MRTSASREQSSCCDRTRASEEERDRDRERERDRGREGDLVFPLRTPIPSDQGPTLIASFNRNYFLTPNIATGVKASALGFGGDAHIRSTTCTQVLLGRSSFPGETQQGQLLCTTAEAVCQAEAEGPGPGGPRLPGLPGLGVPAPSPLCCSGCPGTPARITAGENPALSLGLSLQRRSNQGE